MNYNDYVNAVEEVVDRNLTHINIVGYTGKWTALEKITVNEMNYYLFEHDTYGDCTCYLVTETDNNDIIYNVYETYDGLIDCLIDEDIIEI